LSGRGLCDELITRPEESYRLCCVVVCDLETSRIGAPYIYDINSGFKGLNPSVQKLVCGRNSTVTERYCGRSKKKILHCCWRFSEPNTGAINTFFEVRHSRCVFTNITKMKRFRSLNRTNGLLAKVESSYVTTCFGLHLWSSSGYNLEDKGDTYYIISPSEDSHTLRNNRPAPFFYPPEQTRAALYTLYFTLCTLHLLG